MLARQINEGGKQATRGLLLLNGVILLIALIGVSIVAACGGPEAQHAPVARGRQPAGDREPDFVGHDATGLGWGGNRSVD